MSSIIEELKRESITIHWVLLTALGAAINSIFWSQYLFFSPRLLSSIPDLTGYSLLYALTIFLFSLGSSLSLPEKRIVAPSDVQLGSFPIILTVGYAILYQNLAGYIVTIAFSFALLYILGQFLNRALVGIIGIYGTRQDCCFYSYSVKLPIDDLLKRMKEEDFTKATNLSQSKRMKKTRVFHTSSDERCQAHLFLKPSRDQDSKTCLVNIIGYERTRYGIRKSQQCEYRIEMITCLLSKLYKAQKEPKDDAFYETSMHYALLPIRNRLQSKRISQRIVLACVFLAFIVVPMAMFKFGLLPSWESLAAIEIPTLVAALDLFARLKK